MAGQSQTGTKSKFPLIWLLAWLLSWPLAVVFSIIFRLILPDGSPTFVNLFVLLTGFYGLFGWIPFLIVLLRNKR